MIVWERIDITWRSYFLMRSDSNFTGVTYSPAIGEYCKRK